MPHRQYDSVRKSNLKLQALKSVLTAYVTFQKCKNIPWNATLSILAVLNASNCLHYHVTWVNMCSFSNYLFRMLLMLSKMPPMQKNYSWRMPPLPFRSYDLTPVFWRFVFFTKSRDRGDEWLARLSAVWEDPGSNLTADGCVYRDGYCDMQPWARTAPYCNA